MPYNAAYIGFVYTSLGLKGHHNGWWQREGQRRGSWLHLQTRGPRRESSASSFSFLVFFKTRGGARSTDSRLISTCSCWEDRLISSVVNFQHEETLPHVMSDLKLGRSSASLQTLSAAPPLSLMV